MRTNFFIITIVAVFCFIAVSVYAADGKPKAVDSCGCMTKTHNTIKQAYRNIEQENGLIWDETETVLNASVSPNPKFDLSEAKKEAKKEQDEIASERAFIKKHLVLIEEGMSNDEHLILVEEYKEMVSRHSKLLKGHNEFFIKFNKKSD